MKDVLLLLFYDYISHSYYNLKTSLQLNLIIFQLSVI